MTEKELVEGMAEYANQDLSKAMSLVADMLIALSSDYVAILGGDIDEDILLQGDASHRTITIHALKGAFAAEPGWVVYIKDLDDPDLWERSSELPSVYPNEEIANQVIEAFCKLADNASFSYARSDFKVIEQFISQGDECDPEISEGDQTSQQG